MWAVVSGTLYHHLLEIITNLYTFKSSVKTFMAVPRKGSNINILFLFQNSMQARLRSKELEYLQPRVTDRNKNSEREAIYWYGHLLWAKKECKCRTSPKWWRSVLLEASQDKIKSGKFLFYSSEGNFSWYVGGALVTHSRFSFEESQILVETVYYF